MVLELSKVIIHIARTRVFRNQKAVASYTICWRKLEL